MATTVTARHDVAEYLRTPEEVAAYLAACLDEADGDAAFVGKALGDIARARGLNPLAQDPGDDVPEEGRIGCRERSKES